MQIMVIKDEFDHLNYDITENLQLFSSLKRLDPGPGWIWFRTLASQQLYLTRTKDL